MLCLLIDGFGSDLLNDGCDIDAGPDSALHLALRKRFADIAIMLIQAGADFELRDSVSIRYFTKLFITYIFILYKFVAFFLLFIQI